MRVAWVELSVSGEPLGIVKSNWASEIWAVNIAFKDANLPKIVVRNRLIGSRPPLALLNPRIAVPGKDLGNSVGSVTIP